MSNTGKEKKTLGRRKRKKETNHILLHAEYSAYSACNNRDVYKCLRIYNRIRTSTCPTTIC